jgi:23S rRNA pseudouridine2605 synthase
MAEKRINKILQEYGLASRREADRLIELGLVEINGLKVLQLGTLANPDIDRIRVRGRELKKPEEKVTYLLNKPKGYICSNKRMFSENLVLDLFEKEEKRLFTVGRLDKETEGLLLVSNDGDLANKIIHPSSNITKEYIAYVEEEVSDRVLRTLCKGVEVEGTWVKPYVVKRLDLRTLSISVKEGKKHEVRLLVKNADLSLIHLERIKIGNLTLQNLPVGSYRILSTEEKRLIFNSS